MIEYIIAFIIIFITLIYFTFIRTSHSQTINKRKTISNTKTSSQETNLQTPSQNKDKPKNDSTSNSINNISDNKNYILNSFREGKEMRNPFVSKDGKTILFHDEKRVCLCYLTNLEEKNPKFISKTVEQDTISDASYSEDKKYINIYNLFRLISVGLKNSKQIIFYELIKENDKIKLGKTNRCINSTRKFEINKLTISKDGNYVFTTGNGQDTQVQVFDVKTGVNLDNIDTNELQNVQIKMTPDDKYVAISTYMYEIAVLELKRTLKFNKAIDGDEITLKVLRNKSVSGIKTPIDSFDFSNENKFFIVACENTRIKIFQNFGNFEESKVHSEFFVKEVSSFSNDKISLYISSMFNGKLIGLIAASKDTDIFIFDIDGNLIRNIRNAHDSKICLLKLVKRNEGSDECVLLSGSKDGRFNVWKTI